MTSLTRLLVIGLAGWIAPSSGESDADGSARGITITWTVPEACPPQPEFARSIERFLGYPLANAPSGKVSAELRQDERERWIGHLWFEGTFGGPDAERRLAPARTCNELVQAAAFVTAMAIDPEVAGRVPPQPEEDESIAEPAALTAPPPQVAKVTPAGPAAPTPTVEPPPKPRQLDFAVHGGVGISWGDQPKVGVPFELGAALLWKHVRLGVDGRYWIPHRFEVGAGRLATFHLGSGALEVCPRWTAARWVDLYVCAGAELGQTVVKTRGFVNAHDPRVLWAAWRLRPRVVLLPSSRFGVVLAVEGFGPLGGRHTYTVGGVGELHSTRFVGVRGVIAIEGRFSVMDSTRSRNEGSGEVSKHSARR